MSAALSGYPIWDAHRLGASRSLLVRMIANVGIDAAISSVPFLGVADDVFFRANRRKMDLLGRHRERARRYTLFGTTSTLGDLQASSLGDDLWRSA